MKSQVANYQTRVLCLRIEPLISDKIYITQYPRDLKMSNGVVYLTGSGYDFTGYSAATSMSAAIIDLEGIAGFAGIDLDAVASGVFDNARCYLFATNWDNPVEDYEPIVASILGKTTLADNRYRIEEMALIDVLGQSVGQTYTASCRHTFGDAGCKVDLGSITVAGTLTSATDGSTFQDLSRTEVDDYFAVGTIQFTSGANAGLKPQEIKSYAADGTIVTFEPFYYLPEIGDSYTMIPGCRKRLEDCRDKWNNVLNFGGFPNVPTSSQYSKVGGT